MYCRLKWHAWCCSWFTAAAGYIPKHSHVKMKVQPVGTAAWSVCPYAYMDAHCKNTRCNTPLLILPNHLSTRLSAQHWMYVWITCNLI
eukprot:jgi/Chrzof1/11553/UNPLg00489.t1